jgi:hypothetical protein
MKNIILEFILKIDEGMKTPTISREEIFKVLSK